MPLKPPARTFVFLLFVAVNLTAIAQVRPPDNRPRNCLISGRVNVNGQPAASAQVIASELTQSRNGQHNVRSAADGSPLKTVFKVRADTNGLYQFMGLPAGQYQVRVSARAFISAENDLDQELGRTITLDDGETREKLDFALVRGSVMTGRIIDTEGRSPIAHPVKLFRVEPDGRLNNLDGNGYDNIRTDDRGIYRAYGLRPGNYAVSAGDTNYFSTSGIRKYRRTFHPDVIEEKQAKIIKLSAGEEKTGIDIRLNAGGKRYEATGRVVDAENGKPVANASISCSKVFDGEFNQAEYDGASGQTDAAGNFQLVGLSSGRYRVQLLSNWDQGLEYYAEGQFFEISGEDASGIVIKATSGAVLSGVAVIEGASNSGLKAKLPQVLLIIFIEGESPSTHQVQLKADGTFRVTGVAPGKVRMFPTGLGDPSFQFLRIERGGSEIKDFLTISKGEKINDLRLVFGQGSGLIRGQVQVVGEPLPKGWQLMVQVQRVGGGGEAASMTSSRSTIVDERGRFTFEGLFSSDYELTIFSYPMAPQNQAGGQVPISQQQKVSVTNGAEVQVNIRFNPTGKQEER